MFDDDSTFLLILMGLMVVAVPVVFVIRMMLLGYAIKKTIEAYAAQQQAIRSDLAQLEQFAAQSGDYAQWAGVLEAARQMQSVVNIYARQQPGAAIAAPYAAQFNASWMKAQREMNQLDAIRRERADLYLTDMKSQACSAGLIL
ncbi:hypothetical protein [Occallatibacter riparius]|uniref:Uncharacterized protein n=1 Tax=Occallatibacter riparius TaxID=1002689 RepID=A0A9J7BRP8_9BACT|nr:hypothetical protein [Occallatibacter riparius]UWZ85247.1 hypothetical protein MOP44_04725 [Occallatibacter riparius]